MSLIDSFVKKEFTPVELETHKRQEEQDAYLAEAGLEDRDTAKLRKTMLPYKEAIAARSEQLQNIRQRKGRKDDWQEYLDVRRRMGRVLHHSDLLRNLRKLMPDLIVVDGRIRSTISIYTIDRNLQSPTLGKVLYLGWLHYGSNPEYEIDIVNDAGIPIGQRRGWRTTLLRLLTRREKQDVVDISGKVVKQIRVRAPLIYERDVQDVFGSPSNGGTASNYRQALYVWRNGEY